MGHMGYLQWLSGLPGDAGYPHEAMRACDMARPFSDTSPAVAVFCHLLLQSAATPPAPLALGPWARTRRGGSRARRGALWAMKAFPPERCRPYGRTCLNAVCFRVTITGLGYLAFFAPTEARASGKTGCFWIYSANAHKTLALEPDLALSFSYLPEHIAAALLRAGISHVRPKARSHEGRTGHCGARLGKGDDLR